MKESLKHLKIDFRGVAFYFLKALRLKGCKISSTFLTYFVCFLKGIQIGKKNRFYGIPILFRTVCSKISIGNNCIFRSDFTSNLIGVNKKCSIATLCENAEVIIGNNCGLSGTTICAAEKIVIGNDVLCGANVTITDSNWHTERYLSKPGPVIIEDNVWLGLNTVVLKSVTIGKNSIVGANSLVVKSIPENVIAAGNPCKVIKRLEQI